ncbi:hypothetical protein [Pseudomonas fluorescens]|uniref:Uncharacterized protein n=1 Tax=Pseudomonas fluorescens TaxID=294 RepID=A0A5E7Q035_PSEFL|nr:hypothetical protein [Pseudomonas fluorescens]VVP55225.1 hypothetical protein PS880_05639 [Pseudomonas fluorescens]
MRFFDWASAPAIKKITTVTGILSGLAALPSLYLEFYPLTNHNPEVVGRWETDYSYPITDGTWSFKGLTTYLHEGKYNVGGVITLEGVVEQKKFKFSYSVVGAGTWTADHELLSISLISLKTIPKSLNLSGIDFSPELVAKLSGRPVGALDDSYPNGLSDEYHLKSVKPDRLTLLAVDPSGKSFNIELHRQAALSAAQ